MAARFQSRPAIHVFLSYTGREEEVKVIQPLVDRYCVLLWIKARAHGLDVFYDHFSLERKWYDDDELKGILRDRLLMADMFVGFISPAYVESPWCCFEWKEGPMTPRNGRQLPTQTVDWKPDYKKARAHDPAVVSDLKSRTHTEVHLANTDLAHLYKAAESAASDGLALLLHAAALRREI